MKIANWTSAAVLVWIAVLTAGAQAPAKHDMTFADLIAMHRVSDPQISPDGKLVAYSVATPDLEANRNASNIWIVPLEGGASRQITRSGHDTRPRWSPDGMRIAFLSSREGTPQVYTIWLAGGEPTKLTTLSTGADNELWSPDGKTIAFVSGVYPDCKDDECNRKRNEEKDKSKVKARIYEKLLYRHWTQWWDGTRSHLFVQPVDGGAARDLTAGADYDVPPFSLEGPEAIAFSPDSRELCFTANTDKDEALSTNSDLFTVKVAGDGAPKRITTNPGADWGPVYSPDRKWIAYRAQLTAGYESDAFQLMLYDRESGKGFNLTDHIDQSVDSYAWTPDSKTIYFNSEEKAQEPVFAINVALGSKVRTILPNSFNPEFAISPDGKSLVFTRTDLTMPAELFVADSQGVHLRKLTSLNEERLAQINLTAPEAIWFKGAEGAQVEGLLLRPPNFDASKKYPMLLAIHGGPQGAWGDSWGYRWNPQVFAAPGYVVLMINPRGSTGYGQKFVAEISGDWGGKVVTDLMNGVDYAIAKYPFIDGSRLAAAGGSYGGYMIDWLESQSKGRFKCLISHAGPYDNFSMYATEELWFEEWEFKGTPWNNPELYEKWNPSRFAADFGKYKTPTLVIGGEMDFRIPYTQELEFFSALQRQGVPSKLLLFPDEGHWVLKPLNSELWYKTFLGWLATYLK